MERYFDLAVGSSLLYPFERLQHEALIEKFTKQELQMCDIYGAEHLIRLFVKLPSFCEGLQLEKTQLTTLHAKLDDLMRFMAKNKSEFFKDGYVTASHDYLAAYTELSLPLDN